MQPHIRDRINRKLDSLSDERGYQVLDYIEFLDARYGDPQAQGASPFTRFTEAVEDRMRAGRISSAAVAETVGLMNKAAGLLNNALQATRAAANELASTPAGAPHPAPAPTTAPTPAEASSPARGTPEPGSGAEKL